MTAAFDEAALRHWLVDDYLVTNIGCSPDDIDWDASMHDLGVGSRDAVVLSGELSELLGRAVSPVEFWFTVWNRLPPAPRAGSDANGVQSNFRHDGPAARCPG